MNTARPDGYYWGSDRVVAYLAGVESGLIYVRLLEDGGEQPVYAKER
ncbi:MAG: hypothetical protein QOH69_1830 [Actinomycetota bacterium]|jgi:hypothetical protein|nr:hypothetical protein [Actinomycetota bacterium]MDT5050914.1 hypothetical protein [Mycobacterium sp.]